MLKLWTELCHLDLNQVKKVDLNQKKKKIRCE